MSAAPRGQRMAAILAHIRANPGCSTKDIAAAMGLQHRAAVRQLSRLRKLGAIDRGGWDESAWWPEESTAALERRLTRSELGGGEDVPDEFLRIKRNWVRLGQRAKPLRVLGPASVFDLARHLGAAR